MIQYQHWEDSIRILVTDELHHGSVQVFIPKHTEDKPLMVRQTLSSIRCGWEKRTVVARWQST